MNPFNVVRDFERAVADYAGASFGVATTSCTMALLLACAWFRYRDGPTTVSIPKRTYVGVPMSIINAGHKVEFRDQEWSGGYRLEPLPVWDSARWLTSGVHLKGQMTCLSFHWRKHLGISQGGMILLDDFEAVEWLRRARFDGRREGVSPKDDTFDFVGWHAYLTPAVAAEGLVRLAMLPSYNDPLPNDDYPDLSLMPVFGAEKPTPTG